MGYRIGKRRLQEAADGYAGLTPGPYAKRLPIREAPFGAGQAAARAPGTLSRVWLKTGGGWTQVTSPELPRLRSRRRSTGDTPGQRNTHTSPSPEASPE